MQRNLWYALGGVSIGLAMLPALLTAQGVVFMVPSGQSAPANQTPENPPPQIDSAAVRMLDLANSTMGTANTLQGHVRTTYLYNGQPQAPSEVSFWARQPGVLRLDVGGSKRPEQAPGATPDSITPVMKTAAIPAATNSSTMAAPSGVIKEGNQTIITGDALKALMEAMKAQQALTTTLYTGKQTVTYRQGNDTVRTSSEPNAARYAAEDNGLQAFFHIDHLTPGQWSPSALHSLLLRSVKSAGKETWHDTTYDVVDWTYATTYTLPQDTIVYTTRFYIGSDHLIHRSVTTGTNGYTTDREYALHLNAPVPDSAVAVPSRPGLVTVPSHEASGKVSLAGQTWNTVTAGAAYVDGTPVDMASLLKGSKAVVLWLWTYNCSGCREEMPKAEEMLRELGPKGVKFIALDYGGAEDAANARDVQRFNNIKMPIVIGATAWSEAMMSHQQTLVVLDHTGRVAYNGEFDAAKLESVLAKM